MTESKSASAYEQLAAHILGLIIVVPLRGWVLAQLWEWFVTKAVGWHPISVALGSGLALTLGALRPFDKEPETRPAGTLVVMNVGLALLSVGVGWFVLQWVNA